MELNSSLDDVAENLIAATSLEIEINEVESPSEYTDQEIEEAEKLEVASSTTATVVINWSFTAGLMTGDLASGWNFVNAIQLIAFIPMMKTELPI